MYTAHATFDNIAAAINRGVGALRHHNASAEAIAGLEAAAEQLWALRRNAPPTPTPAPLVIETPIEVLAASLPAISGGAPYEPSQEDWEEFAAWSDSLDDGRDWDAYAAANETPSDRDHIAHIAAHGCD